MFNCMNMNYVYKGVWQGTYTLTAHVRIATFACKMDINGIFEQIKGAHGIDFNLKPEQVNILELLCQNKSVVANLPTGYGKSIIFMMLPKILDQVSASIP